MINDRDVASPATVQRAMRPHPALPDHHTLHGEIMNIETIYRR